MIPSCDASVVILRRFMTIASTERTMPAVKMQLDAVGYLHLKGRIELSIEIAAGAGAVCPR